MKVCRKGHQYEITSCPICRRKRYLSRKSEENESNRQWINNNRERYQKKQKEYRESHPDKVIEMYKDWVEENPIHSIWRGMKHRCYNQENEHYQRYGARGITVCDRWIGDDGYKNFESDMGPRPTPLHTIDRINNDGNYEPGNCHWATRKEQQRNTRWNVIVTINGRSQCLSAWAEESGIRRNTLEKRINKGWPEERWLEPPDSRFQRFKTRLQ